jgi:polysaccharide export outer membrane protein
MYRRSVLDLSGGPLAAALFVALALSACAGAPDLPVATYATHHASGAPARTYRIGVGDKLKITIFGEENLSGPFEVGALGTVSMPLVGEIAAKGKTIAEFREGLTARLADGYLKNPRVSVEVLNYRPIYIHGEVKSGGEFQYKNGLKLRDAIAMAGGFTYRADQSSAVIAREGEPEVRVPMPSEVPVLPGDNIRILERFF